MTKEQLEKHAKARQAAIDRAILELGRAARELAADLYEAFFAEMAEMAKDGVLDGNVNRVNTSTAWRNYYTNAKSVGVAILKSLEEVADTVKDYFADLFGRPQSDFDRVAEQLIRQLGYDGAAFTKGGYLRNLMEDTSVERRVKALAIQAIRAGKSLTVFKSDLKAMLLGSGGKMGIVEAHYYTNASTAYSEFERAMSNDVAERNNLNHVLWSGPVLRDTRTFCAAKKGKVFTRAEVVAMDGQQWAGKIPGQSTLISQGGYGCVDSLMWITEPMYQEFKRQGR